jgi:nicotinamide-nucleotide amidase
MMQTLPVSPAAQRLVEQLSSKKRKLALAESCTCGMAAAMIGGVPGASNVFCGSSVTYRAATKQGWLGVDDSLIERYSTESRETTSAMVTGLLTITPEADLAAAITGHLGPNAPPEKDGIVFVAFSARNTAKSFDVVSEQFKLAGATRSERQWEASERWLKWIAQIAESGK